MALEDKPHDGFFVFQGGLFSLSPCQRLRAGLGYSLDIQLYEREPCGSLCIISHSESATRPAAHSSLEPTPAKKDMHGEGGGVRGRERSERLERGALEMGSRKG